jgi:hypothetical protein
MKYKHFAGNDEKKVEAEINAWLKGKKIRIGRGDSSIGKVSVSGKDAEGKRRTRQVSYLSVNVWYEDGN